MMHWREQTTSCLNKYMDETAFRPWLQSNLHPVGLFASYKILTDIVLLSLSLMSCSHTPKLLYLLKPWTYRGPHQHGIITTIKSSRGADFSYGVHHLTQQWTDLSESPFSPAPQKTHLHTLYRRTWQSHWQASTLTNRRHKKYDSGDLFFSTFPRFSFLPHSSTHHVETKQCPHVSVVQPQRLGKILSGQLHVFQSPLSVLHLCEEALSSVSGNNSMTSE